MVEVSAKTLQYMRKMEQGPVSRVGVPKKVLVELSEKGLITVRRSRKKEMISLSNSGTWLLENTEYATERTTKKQFKSTTPKPNRTGRKEKARIKKYAHYIPGTLNGVNVDIKCVDCGIRRTIPASSLFQVEKCKSCTLKMRAKVKREHRNEGKVQ